MPQWKFTVDVNDLWENDDLTFEQQRDALVTRIKASHWYGIAGGEYSDLNMAVSELAEAEDFDDFNEAWAEIYNLADADRAWIATF